MLNVNAEWGGYIFPSYVLFMKFWNEFWLNLRSVEDLHEKLLGNINLVHVSQFSLLHLKLKLHFALSRSH